MISQVTDERPEFVILECHMSEDRIQHMQAYGDAYASKGFIQNEMMIK